MEISQNFVAFSEYMNFTFKDCDTFVYENGHCFLGKATLSNGNVITGSDYATPITLYATDEALIHYLTPGQDAHLVTTYCCVTALKIQENFGTVQLDVNSGIITYLVDAVTSSGILKAKQKLGIIFYSDKLGGIDLTKFSKLTMCSA